MYNVFLTIDRYYLLAVKIVLHSLVYITSNLLEIVYFVSIILFSTHLYWTDLLQTTRDL